MTESHEKVAQVLGNPIFTSLDDKGEKLRRYLLFFSLCSIFLEFGGLQINPESSFLGLKFLGLTNELTRNGLLCVNSYLFLHYIWSLSDSFYEWRLRITGTRVAHVTTGRFSTEAGDYPDDPRQSTLYNWWKDQAKQIGNTEEKIKEVQSKIADFEKELEILKSNTAAPNNLHNVISSISHANTSITNLSRSIDNTKRTIESNRPHVSLERFDNWFQFFIRSQNLRWFVFDLIIPVFIAGTALSLLSGLILKSP